MQNKTTIRTLQKTSYEYPRIRRYLNAWLAWWVRTSQSWHDRTVLLQFIHSCRDSCINGIAAGLLFTKYREIETIVSRPADLDFSVTA